MLMAVKMHPSLVTTNKDYEITAEKYVIKKFGIYLWSLL